mgnify:CR=1 FL=1
MTLWIDADACPRPVRDVTVKAARRKQIELVLVANSAQQLPPGPGIRQVTVAAGADAADGERRERELRAPGRRGGRAAEDEV